MSCHDALLRFLSRYKLLFCYPVLSCSRFPLVALFFEFKHINNDAYDVYDNVCCFFRYEPVISINASGVEFKTYFTVQEAFVKDTGNDVKKGKRRKGV